MRSMAAAAALLCAGLSPASAEEVCIKYHKCISLDQFACETYTRSTLVNRLCYYEEKRYLVVWLGKPNTPYHYCAIDAAAVKSWKGADSMGRFYNANIRSKRGGEHGSFDCRDHPIPEV